MRSGPTRWVLVALWLGAGAVRADDAGVHPAPPRPGADFQSLVRALSGDWSLAVRFEPTEPGAKPTEARGTERWRTAAGGTVLVEEEFLPMGGREVHLLGLLWWDNKEQKLGGMECNEGNPRICDLRGALNDITLSWDGHQLVIEEIEHRPAGKTMLWRESYSEIRPDSFVQAGELGPPGGPLRRVFTIHAARVK